MDPVAEGTTTKYLRGPSGQSVHGIIRNGIMTIAGADRHGDISFTLSTTGAVTDTSIVDPFGKSLGTTGTKPNIGFQSDYTDPTSGLVWMGARWYNPNTATFTARDTVPGSVGAYATMNRYTYALNNPLTYTDPTGRNAMGVDGGGGNSAPANCDNACQYAHLQQTGNLYDDASDAYNDRFQNGDLDATTEIHEDADGNPVIVVYNDIGITSSSAGRTVTYPLGGNSTSSSGSGPSADIGTVVSTDPLIPAGAVSLANASSFGPKAGTDGNVGVALVKHHRSLIKRMAKLVGVNASVIAKILMEENNFGGKMGAWSNNAERFDPRPDPRYGIANMHYADAEFMYDKDLPGFSNDFIFDALKEFLPKKYDFDLKKGGWFEVSWTAESLAKYPNVIHEESAHDQQMSIAFLAVVLGTTNRMLTGSGPRNPAVTRDEALILSRKVGGWAAKEAFEGRYDKYKEIVKEETPYGGRVDIMNIGPGQRPTWLDRYDQYNPGPLLQ